MEMKDILFLLLLRMDVRPLRKSMRNQVKVKMNYREVEKNYVVLNWIDLDLGSSRGIFSIRA